ncbi:MAG: methyltransferase domain-containing protein [Caldilineaceae bacterium]
MDSVPPSQNTYNHYADRYAEGYTSSSGKQPNFNRDVVIPPLLDVVGDVAGLTVLDAGCGEGVVSRLLAERGATVTGIDVAPRFIELAQERDTSGTITYLCRNLSQPLPAYQGQFDRIVSNLVLNDVPDYQGFIGTLATLLKPGGRIVLSMNNPYSAVFRQKVDNYFDSTKATLYGMARQGIAVYYYHRTMEEYMTAFHANDLLLRRLLDVHFTEEDVKQFFASNRDFPWYDMYTRFPFMILLDLVKQ